MGVFALPVSSGGGGGSVNAGAGWDSVYEDVMGAVHGLPAWRGQAHHAEDRLQCRRSCVKSEAVAKRNEQLVRKSSESTTTFIYFYSFGKHHAHEHTRARGGRTCMTTYMNFSAQADAVMRAVNEGRAIRSAHGLASGQSNHNSQILRAQVHVDATRMCIMLIC